MPTVFCQFLVHGYERIGFKPYGVLDQEPIFGAEVPEVGGFEFSLQIFSPTAERATPVVGVVAEEIHLTSKDRIRPHQVTNPFTRHHLAERLG